MANSNHRRSPKTGLRKNPEAIHLRILLEAVTPLIKLYPWAKVLNGHLRARNWPKLLEWAGSISPQTYGEAEQYFAAIQVSSLIRKYPFSSRQIPGLNPEATAREKFAASEHRCKRVNTKFRLLQQPKYQAKFASYALFERARSYIRRVLGRTPNYERIYKRCDFTEGASVGVHGNATNLARKLTAESWSVTPMALKYVIPALWANVHFHDYLHSAGWNAYDPPSFEEMVMSRITWVRYNKLGFVPKTALTHRVIAVEPLLNGFVQKGVGEEIRILLESKMGISLKDQTRNQRFAYAGSMGGFNPYCTLDLSAASDSVATWLVKYLLPEDWFDFMAEIRSPSHLMPDEQAARPYEKFVSMGNGFCFPLESLIFAALTFAASGASGCSPYDFSVYGDDIIVRQSAALLTTELLKEAGFRLNTEKSFIVGPFRESCGADWTSGQDVRPVILDKPITDIRHLFALHNSMLRSPLVEAFTEGIREEIRAIAEETHRGFLRPGREPGDTCFSVPLDVAVSSPRVTWPRRPRNAVKHWHGTVVRKTSPRRPFKDEGSYYSSWRWEEILSLPVSDVEVEEKNPCGLDSVKWMAVMRGASTQSPFSLRYSSTATIVHVSRPWKDEHESAALLRACKIDEKHINEGEEGTPARYVGLGRWIAP